MPRLGPLPSFLQPDKLVVVLFTGLLGLLAWDAERLIAAQQATNDTLVSLSNQVSDVREKHSVLENRVGHNEADIVRGRLAIVALDNRIRDLEIGPRRRLNYEVVPSLPRTTPINSIIFSLSPNHQTHHPKNL